MLKFISSEAKKWHRISECWSMIEEANLIASKDGLELRAMDPSRAAMVDFSMPVTVFETYECKKGPHRLGLNIEEFTAIMKRISNNDTFTLELKEPTKIELSFSGDLEKTYGLALLDLGDGEFPPPKITHNASITLLTKTFQKLLKDAELVSDQVIIEANKSEFTLKSSSETKDFSVTLERDHDEVADFKVNGEHRACYSLSHLKDMTRPFLHDLLKISFSSEIAVEFSYPVLLGGKLRYFLAPRIEV